MTEAQIQQKIRESERHIQDAYSQLRDSTNAVIKYAPKAASLAQTKANVAANGRKIGYTAAPLSISIVGTMLFSISGLIAFILFVAGIVLAVMQYKKIDKENQKIAREYRTMVNNVQSGCRELSRVLQNNEKI